MEKSPIVQEPDKVSSTEIGELVTVTTCDGKITPCNLIPARVKGELINGKWCIVLA